MDYKMESMEEFPLDLEDLRSNRFRHITRNQYLQCSNFDWELKFNPLLF